MSFKCVAWNEANDQIRALTTSIVIAAAAEGPAKAVTAAVYINRSACAVVLLLSTNAA